MFANINPASDLFLANLQIIQTRMSVDQQQLTSGLRVRVASDVSGPNFRDLAGPGSKLAGVQQTQENLSAVSPRVNSGESAIQQAIQLLDTATSLASGAAGSTSSARPTPGQRASGAKHSAAIGEPEPDIGGRQLRLQRRSGNPSQLQSEPRQRERRQPAHTSPALPASRRTPTPSPSRQD